MKLVPVSGNRWTALTIAVVLITPSLVEASIELTAEVDRTSCVVGNRITYTATVSGAVSLPDIEPPDFDGFDIVSGPMTSSSVQVINTKITRTSSLTYVIRAKKQGTFIIKPSRAVKRKKVYTSNKIEITVSGSSRKRSSVGRRSAKSPSTGSQENIPELFLVAETDRDTVYHLEMITVSYKLYLRVQVNNYGFARLPQATGFWVEEFPTPRRPQVRDVTIKGASYKVAEVRKVGLFPTRTGTLTIDPLTADVTVERPAKRRRRRSRSFWDDSFWDDPFSRTRQEVVSVSTEPVEITVLPLPTKRRPAGFQGDVGDFDLRVSYDRSELAQHEALTVKVTISGSGYLKSVDAPELILPKGFEKFDPTVEQNINSSVGKMRGQKTFTYLTIPRISGNYEINPIRFSYFNPETHRYHTLRKGGREIEVLPVEGSLAGGMMRSPTEVAILGSDIRFIRELDEPLAAIKTTPYRSALFFITLALSPFLFVIGLGVEKVVEKRLSDPVAVRRRKAPEQMRRALAEAHKKIKQDNTTEAIEAASRGLTELVGAVIDEPSAGLTGEIVKRKLEQAGADEELVGDVIRLLSESDHVRFSGAELDRSAVNAVLTRFSETASRLEKV